jgi:hypothetical protein
VKNIISVTILYFKVNLCQDKKYGNEGLFLYKGTKKISDFR